MIQVYADDFNILRGSVHTIKENAEALVMTSVRCCMVHKTRIFNNN
jgi:hypothetical protein